MLKNPATIDPETVFIVSAGCSYEFIQFVKAEIQKRVKWQKIIITTASATVTSNCGPGTFGVLFARK
jgi:fatty acid-binding protein DegV